MLLNPLAPAIFVYKTTVTSSDFDEEYKAINLLKLISKFINSRYA